MVSPEITQLVAAVVHTTSPATGPARTTPADVTTAEATVTTKPVTADPPLFTGAVHETVVVPFWNDVPVTPVGAPATVAGVTEPEATEASDEPISLLATTVNVYAVPLVRPVIVQESSTVSHTTTPSPLVITYPVTGDPPVDAGANQVSVIVESPETPMTLVGANGTVASAPATTGADTVAAEEPTPLVTTTLNVYVTPETRPVNSHDVDVVSQIASVVVSSPSDAVTVKPVIGEPRGFGTDHETVAEPPAAPTETDDTASGKPAGTTAADNTDAEEEPDTFEAFTLNR